MDTLQKKIIKVLIFLYVDNEKVKYYNIIFSTNGTIEDLLVFIWVHFSYWIQKLAIKIRILTNFDKNEEILSCLYSTSTRKALTAILVTFLL